MAASKCEISRCGLCRFYVHEGRRGGTCSQLNVPVGSRWQACCLGASPFQVASEVKISEIEMGISHWKSSHEVKPTEMPIADRTAIECSMTEYSVIENPVAQRSVVAESIARAPMPAEPEKAIAQPKVSSEHQRPVRRSPVGKGILS
ncbi:MAG: hypothetical protein AAF703_07730 [Cyanobacteria bacterium P01_D01_bin.105]